MMIAAPQCFSMRARVYRLQLEEIRSMLAIRLITLTRIGLVSLVLLGLAACSTSEQTLTLTPAASPGLAGIVLSNDEMSDIQVEVMVFSGRVNPRWSLTAQEQARVHELLAHAAPGAAQPIEGQLGYTGFNLTFQTATERIMLRVYDGVMSYTDSRGVTFYQDDRRGLERFLLETSRPHIDPALYQTIREALPPQ
jgi:hypothetical protein